MSQKPILFPTSMELGIDNRRCKIHNTWKKKGICPICWLEKRKATLEEEKKLGIVKMPIKITKI